MKIYYLIPDLYIKKKFTIKSFLHSLVNKNVRKYVHDCFFIKPKPVGGIKVIYQHCILLRQLGYEAIPVLMGKYHGNFYGYDIECKHYKEVINEINVNDVVVGTEFEPYEALEFVKALKILFVQNWLGLSTRLKEADLTKSYISLGYNYVITCSDYCTDYVIQKMGIEAITITNGIDLTKFHPRPELRQKYRILALPRKNHNDLKMIMDIMEDGIYDFKLVDGLTQDELIMEYQSADIFLATGYPEGFGLPPLEAMSCGCVVVGFTGGGAKEFMHDMDTALVAKDGDVNEIVSKLNLLAENDELKENIRQSGYKKSQYYSLAATEKQLDRFFNTLIYKDK